MHLTLIFLVICGQSCEKPDEIPVLERKYSTEIMVGFRIKYNLGFPHQDQIWIDDLSFLKNHLDTMRHFIPYADLDVIQDKSIFLSYPEKDFTIRFWDPDHSDEVDDKLKIGSIEIGNMPALRERMENFEPGLLVHAFALQYYYTILDETDLNKIENDYQSILQQGLYASVSHNTSSGVTEVVPSPALNDSRSFFAILSEAYFDKSDYFPFSYENLLSYDETGFKLMEDIWGRRRIKDYSEVKDHEFTLLIRKVEAGHAEIIRALANISEDLQMITDSLQDEILDILNARPMWLELQNGNGACFHPNKIWILENDHVPEKAHCVEVTNAKNFNNWSGSNQPMIVLHELSHYYHYHELGWNNNTITSAYENAKGKGLYINVEYINPDGSVVTRGTAYALENEKEYFAELSEAYWGKNDYYPFTRDQLKEYDPVGYQMVESLWSWGG